MPLAEAQSRWIAELLRGEYALPTESELRARMQADHERQRSRFYSSPRHTMEVDFDQFLVGLDRERRRGRRRAAREGGSADGRPTTSRAGAAP
jgi:hypothetical protein